MVKSVYPKIAQVVVGLPVDGPFDYAVPKATQKDIAVGQRVRVLFNRRNRLGFIVGLKEKSSFKQLNSIQSILDYPPSLNKEALILTKHLSEYFGCSWGEAIEAYLPSSLRKTGRVEFSKTNGQVKKKKTKLQKTLIHDVNRKEKWPYLFKQMKDAIGQEGQILYLVPEASMMADVRAKIIEEVTHSVVVLDRKTSVKDDRARWIDIKQGKISVVIGTRSGIFAPMPVLSLIIVDEEEHDAYKQEQPPHYHVHDAALMRLRSARCDLTFVSSCPSARIWYESKKKSWQKITLSGNSLAPMQLVDMSNYNPHRSSILSFPLQNAIQKTLKGNEKIIILMNRRGFSSLTKCNQCGFILKCERCDTNLTYLYSKKKMVCRHCNFTTELPKICPHCQSSYLRSIGTGIEKLESEIARIYPQAVTSRYDKESQLPSKDVDVIIGTQAILKLQDHFNANIIAWINFDAELNRMDFRSAQKAFSLLMHLRQFASEKVIVQTSMVDNYCLKAAKSANFDQFYKEELKLRKELGLPPFKQIIKIGLRGNSEEFVFEQSHQLFKMLEKNKPQGCEMIDPHPDVLSKLRDKYRFTIDVKGRSVKTVLPFVKSVLKGFRRRKGIVVTIDVDS